MKTLFSGDIHNKSDIITPLIDMYIQQRGYSACCFAR